MKSHYDQQGFKAESAVLKWLELTGYRVEPSTQHENVVQDIDCWVYGRHFISPQAVSIKAMTAGIAYNQLCFELWSERTKDGLGWFQSGSADYYLVVRDTQFSSRWNPVKLDKPYRPRMYWLPKLMLQYHVITRGWHHVRGLSAALLAQQGGKNTYCGYLLCKDILRPEMVEFLPEDWYAMVEGE